MKITLKRSVIFKKWPIIVPALLVILVAAILGVRTMVTSSASSLSPVTPLIKPNIVLILTDDQTMESVAKMPYVSSRTDWYSFDRAQINNALCCPSRSSILTGQFDTHTSVVNNTRGSRPQTRVRRCRCGCSGRGTKRACLASTSTAIPSAAASTPRRAGSSGRFRLAVVCMGSTTGI